MDRLTAAVTIPLLAHLGNAVVIDPCRFVGGTADQKGKVRWPSGLIAEHRGFTVPQRSAVYRLRADCGNTGWIVKHC